MAIVPFQQSFSKEIPYGILGNSEYLMEVEILRTISEFLIESGAEDSVVQHCLLTSETEAAANGEVLSYKQRVAIQERAIQALRTTILRKHLNVSYRHLARDLALAPLYQWFCRINRLLEVQVPGKSKLQAAECSLPEDLIRQLHETILKRAFEGAEALGIEAPLDLSECYFDTFCLQTNIHYPVDWVLLRDASRTLMLAVQRIRKHGIVNRMAQDCQQFVTKMNRLCIEMTHSARRRHGGDKARKRCFREMKTLMKRTEQHARRHLEKLEEQWPDSDFSESEVRQITAQIENVLEQLPEAIRQGHERIIGGRKVGNEEKILSLYEDGVNVITRHKAGAEVEFGNKVSLMEQKQGLIVDWDLAKDGAPGDHRLCRESYDRTRASFGKIGSLATDRGCSSMRNSSHLENHGTYDATCPKSVTELSLRMQEEEFRAFQKRRGSTEARISILKKFTGDRLTCKGYEHRRQQFGLCVITHNLWLLSRLIIAGRAAPEECELQDAG